MSSAAARPSRNRIRCLVLGCALLGAPGCAATWMVDREWVEVRSEHFAITSDLDASATEELARNLELFRAAVLVMTRARTLDSSVPTRVFFFDSPATFRQFLPRSRHVLGYFRPTLRANFVVVLDHGSVAADEVLRHEYVHFLVRNGSSRIYPTWYDEGFAELLRTTGPVGEHVAVGNVPLLRLRQIRTTPWIPLERVLSYDGSQRWTAAQVAMFYAESWGVVHYLTRDLDHAVALGGSIETYLDRIEAGDSVDAACLAAFGMSVSDLDAAVRAHLASGTFTPFGVRADRLTWSDKTDTRRLPRAEVAERLGELSLASEMPAKAGLFFREALDHDPGLARAHAGLADVLAFESRWNEAESQYERAIALDPEDPLNFLDYGEYWLMRARKTDDDEERRAFLSRGRRRLVQAYQLDDGAPEAYAMYGQSFLQKGEDASGGLETLEHALRLLPSSVRVQLMLAEAYISLDRNDDALPLLDRILAWSHEGETATRARELLDRIDSPQATESSAAPASPSPQVVQQSPSPSL